MESQHHVRRKDSFRRSRAILVTVLLCGLAIAAKMLNSIPLRGFEVRLNGAAPRRNLQATPADFPAASVTAHAAAPAVHPAPAAVHAASARFDTAPGALNVAPIYTSPTPVHVHTFISSTTAAAASVTSITGPLQVSTNMNRFSSKRVCDAQSSARYTMYLKCVHFQENFNENYVRYHQQVCYDPRDCGVDEDRLASYERTAHWLLILHLGTVAAALLIYTSRKALPGQSVYRRRVLGFMTYTLGIIVSFSMLFEMLFLGDKVGNAAERVIQRRAQQLLTGFTRLDILSMLLAHAAFYGFLVFCILGFACLAALESGSVSAKYTVLQSHEMFTDDEESEEAISTLIDRQTLHDNSNPP